MRQNNCYLDRVTMTWLLSIDRHVQNVLGSKIVYGAKNESALSSFVSLLKCIDNIPAHYRVEDFAREVLQLLVNTPGGLCEGTQSPFTQNYEVV